jgi:hypothetical protein
VREYGSAGRRASRVSIHQRHLKRFDRVLVNEFVPLRSAFRLWRHRSDPALPTDFERVDDQFGNGPSSAISPFWRQTLSA